MLDKKFGLLLLVIFLIGISSCGKKTDSPTVSGKEDTDPFVSVRIFYDSAMANGDQGLISQAVEKINDFLTKNQDSPKGKEAYSMLSSCYINLKKYDEAINTYNTIISKYPDSKEAINAYIQIGSIYEEFLKDKQKAIEAYQKFLDKYGNSQDSTMTYMIQSVRLLKENLETGKSFEDIIKEPVEKQKNEKK
jgi:TolA-binding protein